jgi:hypothetical protein
MRKLIKETAATTVKRGNPVRYSRSGTGSTANGFSFASVSGCLASAEEVSGDGGLSLSMED